MASKRAVDELSDMELMNELKSLGIKTGPVTPSTRRVVEKKLLKARGADFIDSNFESKNSGESENVALQEIKKSTRESTSSTSSALESPAIFYGVCFDVDRTSSDSTSPSLAAVSPAVFTSKDEALKMAKKLRGARFKGFKTKLEAESFARSRFQEQEQSPAPKDPASNFKTPTPQQLVKFRTIIERGTKDEFQEVVVKNPRYLIGPGDTPVILQEGSRYNALHVAVKSNRKEMCQLIVDTLESDHLWNILLNQESQSAAIHSKRKQFLVDMYLNTPDKGTWETPLHFACKYGHADIVECLVSHPLTDIQRPNKYGETAAKVICSRYPNASSELKSQIKSLLEDSFYIPLLGTIDNSTPPWIGGPWSPEISGDRMTMEGRFSGSALNTLKERNSPGELPITVRAYAGPMSPSKAEEFYRTWKSPSNREQRKSYVQIKRKDDSRGVERIGRDLAHTGRVAWTEYWNFIACYADLSSSQGLEKLEEYLAKKKEKVILSRLSVTPQRVRTVKSVSSILKTPESRTSTIIFNEDGLRHQTVEKSDSDHFNIHDFSDNSSLPSRKVLFSDSELKGENSNIELKDSAQESKLQHLEQQHVVKNITAGDERFFAPLDETANSKIIEPLVDTLAQTLDTLSLHHEQGASSKLQDEAPAKKDLKDSFSSQVTEERGETDNVGVLPCKKKLLYNLSEASSDIFESEDTDLSDVASTESFGEVMVNLAGKSSAIPQNTTKKMPSLSKKQPLFDLKKNILEDEVFENTSETDLTSRKDNCTASCDIAHQKTRKVDHVLSGSCSKTLGSGNKYISVFIHGLQPSKLDLDVFIAIGHVELDAKKYPNIVQWKKLVMSYSEVTQQSWPSPGSPRYHTRHKSLMMSC